MIQAARSGRQNIAERSRAAATSSQTILRLVNAARSNLEELLLDYEDFFGIDVIRCGQMIRCKPNPYAVCRSSIEKSIRISR